MTAFMLGPLDCRAPEAPCLTSLITYMALGKKPVLKKLVPEANILKINHLQ